MALTTLQHWHLQISSYPSNHTTLKGIIVVCIGLSNCVMAQVGERERIAAAEEALARRRAVVSKLEAQANARAQQQRAFARVSPTPALVAITCCAPESY